MQFFQRNFGNILKHEILDVKLDIKYCESIKFVQSNLGIVSCDILATINFAPSIIINRNIA